MKILVVYYEIKNDRNTIDEHLYSFKKYLKDEVYYLNTLYRVPKFVTKIKFDLIIYHYTFLAHKWGGTKYFKRFLGLHKILKKLKGYKVAIPQDEYVHTRDLCYFFREFGIKTVFTCLNSSEWQKVYPKKISKVDHYFSVFPGYVDENSIKRIGSYYKQHNKREFDLGYRARNLPYWLGKHATIKSTLAKKFIQKIKQINSNINYSISTKYKDVFLGISWYKFLANCRVVLGCEGGASIHDPYGYIRKRTEEYIKKHPKATFKQAEKYCFPGKDGNLSLRSLSPRHFEASITKTCQALVEGDYAGIFKRDVHYIGINKDWSNISEVLEKIKDVNLCEQIAENAYRDVVQSGRYTYRQFVQSIKTNLISLKVVKKSRFDFHQRLNDNFFLLLMFLYKVLVTVINSILDISRIIRRAYRFMKKTIKRTKTYKKTKKLLVFISQKTHKFISRFLPITLSI